jgi:hypothetical protein
MILVGCTSPVSNTFVIEEKPPPRPGRILVHDFAVIPADIPPDAPIGARLSVGPSLKPEEITKDRELATNMTAQLVIAIREMGLPAERVVPTATPQANEAVIRGCFVSMHESSAGKRYTVGLDPSASEFLTMLEIFQTTPQGLGHRLASSNDPSGIIVTTGMKIDGKARARASLDDWSGRTVQEIAAGFKAVFQEQGWLRQDSHEKN